MTMSQQHAAVVPPAGNACSLKASCEAAAVCKIAWLRSLALRSGAAVELTEAGLTLQKPRRRRAWATLLTNQSYAAGVKALANSLTENCDSDYPLLIMVGGTKVPEATIADLAKLESCEIRRVSWLSCPAGSAAYAASQFTDCWTKLRVWELEDEFEQIVLLDADMVVVRNIDSLLQGEGPEGGLSRSTADACAVRAVHECFCVVQRTGDGPCAHTCGSADHAKPQAADSNSYFNSGLIVLRPSRAVFAHMLVALAGTDLFLCPFADQDFLNAYFCGAWVALPWVFNATKGLYASHRSMRAPTGPASADGGSEPGGGGRGGDGDGGGGDVESPAGKPVWDVQQVRNIHYTMAKPWDLRHPCHKGYEQLNELWWAAFSEPRTICRMLLKLRMHEKRCAAAMATATPVSVV